MGKINPEEYLNTLNFKVNYRLLTNRQMTKHEIEVAVALYERLAAAGRQALQSNWFFDISD